MIFSEKIFFEQWGYFGLYAPSGNFMSSHNSHIFSSFYPNGVSLGSFGRYCFGPLYYQYGISGFRRRPDRLDRWNPDRLAIS